MRSATSVVSTGGGSSQRTRSAARRDSAGLGRAAVELDVALADERLHARTRKVRQRLGQEAVEPVAGGGRAAR